MIVIIDNYDSFVYNIYQILRSISSKEILIIRNDQASPEEISKLDPEAIIISPGPGSPEKIEDIGYSRAVVETFYREKPILGICLGHQVIGHAMGARIRKARRIYHGRMSRIRHFGGPLYRDLPMIFEAMRYHSYVVDEPPSTLVIDSMSIDDNEIMGFHHASHPLFGIQFHPESVGTKLGWKILSAFLEIARR